MTTIELVANDQLLQVTVNPTISSGEQNTVEVHVDFSDDWDGFSKSAVFFTSLNKNAIYEIVMTDEKCIVPAEVMEKSCLLYIGIRGVNNNEVKTTSLVKYKISEGTPTSNSTEVEPTPDVYQQLLTAYGKTYNSIKKEISDRKSAISTEKAERQAEIAVERARIDNMSTLTEGSTTADAELLDIRVKSDGSTATSAGNAVREQVSELKRDLTQQKEYIFEDIPKAINISEIEDITFKEGWNASNSSVSIPMSKIASYDTYYFIAARDYDIYVDSVSIAYFAIIYGGQYESIFENDNSFVIYCDGGSKRVRNIDGNLPTKTNKLHIAKGSAVAFTISHGKDQAIYGFDKGIKVKDSFKEEIITSIPSGKKSYVQYVTGSIEGSASEGLNIFLPTKVGYIRYAFVHTVSESLHADVWRIHRAYAVDDSFSDRFLLTTTGEWEMAVHLPSRADFSGGYAHGDEIMRSITFIVDGKITDITALTNRTEFNRLEIIQDSDVYDPNDSTTIFAKHGSKHIFDSKMNDHLVVEQALRFTSNQTMTTCYMAMFPPAKETTNAYYEDINFKDTLITTYPIVIDKAREVTIHSEDVGFVAKFSIPKTVETSNLTGGNHLKIHDNGGGDYNKCYYTLCGDANVLVDEVWKTQTNYNLEMVK